MRVKKSRLHNWQILQTDTWKKNSRKRKKKKKEKRKDEKYPCYLKIIKEPVCLDKKKTTDRITQAKT